MPGGNVYGFSAGMGVAGAVDTGASPQTLSWGNAGRPALLSSGRPAFAFGIDAGAAFAAAFVAGEEVTAELGT